MLIVLEGIDGCGKSTHAKLLAGWLMKCGRKVFLTCEPTKGPIGRFIRKVLSGGTRVDPKTLALLFAADRAEHVREITSALRAGKVVVCDRYYHSTVAYQSAQGVDRRWLLTLNEFAPKPDLVIFLDINPKTGAARTRTGEIFEKEKFLRKVRAEYMRFSGMKVVATNRPKKAVQDEICGLVSKMLL